MKDLDKMLSYIAIIISAIVIIFLISGCTLHVVEPEYVDYCFADYRCSWYDYYGQLHSEWLCAEDIQPNMTCK